MFSIVAIPLWHVILPNLCIKNIIVAVPIYIPTNIVGRFTFLHFLSSIDCLLENKKKKKQKNFLIITILTDVKWYLIVVLICISLIICGVGSLFMWLLVIYISSLEKGLFRSSSVLKGFGCCYWTAWGIYIFWRWIPCQLVTLLQVFSPILVAVFSFYLWLPLLCQSF